MKKKLSIIGFAVIAIAVFAMSPLWPYAKSMAVMKVYSYMNEKQSLMNEKGIDIDIPGGGVTKERDWYPFVMTYDADERFQSYTGLADARLTIMYNFPAFDISKGRSLLFDRESPYYNGFYGAYTADGKFGFEDDGRLKTEEVSVVPEFDMRRLVLEDMGMARKDGVFEWKIKNIEENKKYAGFEGWTRIDAHMKVNGAAHQKTEDYQNYIQYGSPEYEAGEVHDFEPVSMEGRVYAKYFEEKDVSIYFYIMAKDAEVLEKCDKEILSESIITFE